MENAIYLKNISKSYGNKIALKDINLLISENQIFGLIGPNGAGKTTMIKIICSLLNPNKGEVKIFGHDVANTEYKKYIGYVSENMGYYEDMTAFQYLYYFGGFYEIKNLKERCKEILIKVDLLNSANIKIRKFSKGMKQRLGIARALLHFPKLIILDEPLIGLDPLGKSKVIEVLKELRENGNTIFISSHELKEIDGICDNIALIKEGEIIAFGNPRKILNGRNAIISYAILLKNYDENINKLKEEFSEIKEMKIKDDILYLKVVNSEVFERKLFKWFLDNNINFSIKTQQLDEIYKEFFKEV